MQIQALAQAVPKGPTAKSWEGAAAAAPHGPGADALGKE